MTSHQAPAPAATPVIVNPSHLHDPTPHGYSTAVITPAAGRLAFISGQGAYDRNGALSPDFATQVEQAYANLAAVIAALGARPDQVVKLTVYVVGHDMSKLGILTETVTRMFGTGCRHRRWSRCRDSRSTQCSSRSRLSSSWIERRPREERLAG